MKKETLDRRNQIANDVMYYIYTHIDTNIDIEELSIQHDVSRFHLQRVFKEIFHMNIYEKIKSIRLSKASNLLLTNKYSTISQIALACGYSSQTAFLKVFKERFLMTPKEWKKGGYKEYSANILSQSKTAMNSKAHYENLEPKIVKMPPIEAYYKRHSGYDKSISKTWQKIYTWTLSHEIKNYEQIGLYHDNPTLTPLKECQYIACIKTDEYTKENSRLPKFKIAGGVYAKFDIQGVYGDVLKFIHWVYHEWLVTSGYETSVKPSYAIYHKNHFLSEDGEFDLSFYVPIAY